MIGYVESNFLLELALAQEQAPEAEAIFVLAEQRAITLVVPVFALSEPFANIQRRTNERNRTLDVVQREVRELGRSATHQPVAAQLQPILALLVGVGDQQTAALMRASSRLLSIGVVAGLNQSTFHQAALYRQQYDLSPQDAIVYASILADIRTRDPAEPKCFISRDIKGFDDLDIKTELRQYNCRFIGDFANGLSYIQSVLGSQGQAGPPPPTDPPS